MPVCVKIGKLVARWALPTARNTRRSSGRDLIPGADLAERARGIVIGLPNERARELLFAHRRDFFRIERLV